MTPQYGASMSGSTEARGAGDEWTAQTRLAIRRSNEASGRIVLVLDDDPTGSQSVHDVELVMDVSAEAIEAAVGDHPSVLFLLTNSRSMAPAMAARVTEEAALAAAKSAIAGGRRPLLVSRSDSTLRGHFAEEVEVLAKVHLVVTGKPVDGVLFAPAFLEAGRFTEGDTHYAEVRGRPVPVAETEFARDARFSFASSSLRHYLAEKAFGHHTGPIVSLSLDQIRDGGAEGIRRRLLEVRDGQYVIVNATQYSDLETVALGVALASDSGKHFVHRSGPSFVRALSGTEPQQPLTQSGAVPARSPTRAVHGAVIVGSHVGTTADQVQRVLLSETMRPIELSVAAVLAQRTADMRSAEVIRVAEVAKEAISQSDVLVMSSRSEVRGRTALESQQIAQQVSAALVAVARQLRAVKPAWMIAKGGITSHTIAAGGLGISRAMVTGQFFPGQISLLRPLAAPADVCDMPFVIFPGNVGSPDALVQVIDTFRAGR